MTPEETDARNAAIELRDWWIAGETSQRKRAHDFLSMLLARLPEDASNEAELMDRVAAIDAAIGIKQTTADSLASQLDQSAVGA